MATDLYKNYHPVTVQDIIYMQENKSGCRLFEVLRKKYPGLMPTIREERRAKLDYTKYFESVLLPRRTSSGWCLDPERLLQMLGVPLSFHSF